MSRLVRRFRALPLRARLSLLVAAAVAFAVAAVSVTCWFIVRGKLYGEIDDNLRFGNVRMTVPQVQSTLDNCTQVPDDTWQPGPRNRPYLQLVKADGDYCLFENSAGAVKVASADVDVAENPDDALRFRNGKDTEGKAVRTMTVPLADGVALLIALPLEDTESTLNELALLLLLASGIGVVGAGAAGLAVARAGLRPVDELTEAVEEVARTEDLGIRIPVADDSDDEVARLSRSFNSMTASLASSRDLQQQLIADAGHELRTPLTSLRTNIELLSRSEETGRPIPEADRKALLASVKAQMTELASLIGDLQELSRPDTGQHTGRARVLAFHDTVEHALRRARLRGPELTITADVEPWYVRAEPSALERAVVNVLDNAVKFSPAGGTVEVRLADGALTVRDHGPGIAADELPHVFDRFWRSPSARALPGSGLGLSIVARTVQQAGGEVRLSPAQGGGTVATIRLPGAPTPPPELP
ncbi:HAMP domain-containing sensor histidine kinase [Streptomyces sp. DH24]|uniref:sensor histidine kinase n=1 Tax=Streptomyces sp. DH24 TaxID=3040123 RepID=UPI0024433380|nr:HAMP domain-containing sensor histidine kinase [Streptomyces sp. DH24]MDG9718717.1 HAMP domain-containing sensor histidine kinase [Streptomyces sp. DH24]